MAIRIFIIAFFFTFYVLSATATSKVTKKTVTNQRVGWPSECFYCHDDGQPVDYIFNSAKNYRSNSIEPNGCRDCHVNNYILSQSTKIPWYAALTKSSINRIKEYHGYVATPKLKGKITAGGNFLKRYTDCGLMRFLNQPVSRQAPFSSSMFPLKSERIDEILHNLSGLLEPCDNLEKSSTNKKIEPTHGITDFDVVTFFNKKCSVCHRRDSGSGAPILRIGIPLLSYSYFRSRVLKGVNPGEGFIHQQLVTSEAGTQIVTKSLVTMPSFDMKEPQLLELYRYISHSKDDLEILETSLNKTQTSSTYYNDIVKDIFNSGCQHCHSQSDETQKVNESIFKTNKKLPTFPNNKNTLNFNEEEFSRISSIGSDCRPSLVVRRLLDRRHEWSGNYQKKYLLDKGMPINMKPLSMKNIKKLHIWTQNQCASPFGLLCLNKCIRREKP